MTSEELLKLWQARTGFQVVDCSDTPQRLRVLGRVLPPLDSWWIVLDRILDAEKKAQWSIDVSQLYYKPAGEIRFAWRIILQAPDGVAQYFQTIASIINSAPRAQASAVDEMPLMGSSASRNDVSATGRGAQGMFRPVVGAMAAAMRMQGGR
jgi:hypothetical protein